MADEEKPEGAENASATAAAGENQESRERMFSQAELDAIVAKRVAKAEKSVERRFQNSEPQTTQKKEPPPASGSEEFASKVAALEARAAFGDAMSDLDWKPSKDDAELLRNAFTNGGDAAMQKLAGRLKPQQQEAKAVDDTSPKYKSPGAPSGAPAEVLAGDALTWSADYVKRLQSEGGLLKEVEKWVADLPGGGGGLFRKQIPKVR
jgi:hypothetical protein